MAVVLSAGFSCTDSPEALPDLSDLAGVYDATTFEYRSTENPAITFDLVADSTVIVDWSIDEDGNYIMGFHAAGEDIPRQGTVTLRGDRITLHATNGMSGTFSLDGSALTVRISLGAEFDFDGDGADDPASLLMIWERR